MWTVSSYARIISKHDKDICLKETGLRHPHTMSNSALNSEHNWELDSWIKVRNQQTCTSDNQYWIKWGPFSIWFVLMLPFRFSIVTQIPLCKSKGYKLENTKNKPNNAHILYSPWGDIYMSSNISSTQSIPLSLFPNTTRTFEVNPHKIKQFENVCSPWHKHNICAG